MRTKFFLISFVIGIVTVIIFGIILMKIFPGYYFSEDVSEERARMIIGLSKIELRGGEVVGTQVDRVVRDIAWKGSDYDESVSETKILSLIEEAVPYMEGARARDMIEWASVIIFPLTPAKGKHKEIDSAWPEYPYYAADGKGNFSFLIEPTKVEYETVFNVSESDYQLANIILPDTHGFNMVAEQAYIQKDYLYMVMACMDFESKSAAALFLAKEGLNIYAPCDRFASLLMNYKEIYGDVSGNILGSAPIRETDYGAVIGDQPITVYLDEKIIVQYTERGYPDQYCDTPWRYFQQISNIYDIHLDITQVTANIGEAGKLVEEARFSGANVIGVRIENEDDYIAVANWLKENFSNRAILFHSAAYEPGIKLFREFSQQTSFGDLEPKIIR